MHLTYTIQFVQGKDSISIVLTFSPSTVLRIFNEKSLLSNSIIVKKIFLLLKRLILIDSLHLQLVIFQSSRRRTIL